MKKGVIFDLDGTLWDACAAIADSWNEYLQKVRTDLEKYHLSVTEADVRGVCGRTMDVFGDILFPTVPDRELRQKLGEGCCEYEVQYLKHAGGAVYPGVVETLKKLHETYELYIVSNCQVGYIEDFLIWSGTTELFADTEDYGTTLKPKSENIRAVVERNQLEAAVYVGDTVMDYKSTCDAGLPFIHCRFGFGTVENVPYVDTFSELPDRIAAVFRENSHKKG